MLPKRVICVVLVWVCFSGAASAETKAWGWRGDGAGMSVANVLVHDRLIYSITTGGVLRVIDQETLKPVYNGRLGLDTITWAYPY